MTKLQKETAFASTFLVGDPNWEQCKSLARAVAINSSNFDWSQPTASRNCKASLSSFNSRSILNLTAVAHFTGRYHALSGFFVIYNDLNLSSRANLTKIWEKGQQLCSTSGASLSNIASNRSYAAQHCFRLPYMASLIEQALCLGEAEIIFGPGDVSWTLGAALVEGRYLQLSTNKPQTTFSILKNTEVISSPIFIFVFLFILLFIVYYSQVKLPMLGKKGPTVGATLPSYIHPKHRPH